MQATPDRAALRDYGVVLFPGFQLLDVAGPIDVLNMLSHERDLSLHIIAASLDPVFTKTSVNPSSNLAQSIVPTHTFAAPPDALDVLLVPGVLAARHLANTEPVETFIQAIFPRLKYLLTVCTGSALLARTGILDGKRATTNKRAWTWAVSQGSKVNWMPQARWVMDGKIWTSSGISAGMDLTYAFITSLYGEDVASRIANASEYTRTTDPNHDAFEDIWNERGRA